MPAALRLLPFLWRWRSCQQALRERLVRLHRDALLSSDAAGHAGCGSRPAPAPALRARVASRVEQLELREGVPLITAPRFRPRRSWTDRLCLNSGIEREGTRLHPRSDWRSPSARELTLLVGQDPGREEICLKSGEAGLIAIPTRLREAWWGSARWSAVPTAGEDYRRFVTAVLEFLRFKRLPLPSRCDVDVLATRPDLKGIRLDPTTGELSGLGFSASGARRTVGLINLGDEATHLVLLNLPADGMRAHLARDAAPDPWSLTPSDLVSHF